MSALAVGVLVAACTSPSPGPTTQASASTDATAVSSTVPSPAPTATPAPTPVALAAACAGSQLAARITAWDNATGHRFAHVEVTNTGSSPCRMPVLDRPQLVDGHGAVLLDGQDPTAPADLTLVAGGLAATDVDASNYCGPDPTPPVTVAFMFPGGTDRFVASPLSATDTSGVPPCFGSPGSAGVISMMPWSG